MKKIAVLLVDDHNIVRQGLRALLNSEPDLEVVGEAENGRKAVALAKEVRPQVVVMDVAMPLLNGYEATRQIVKTLPTARVLVLSSYKDEACVRQVITAGASGYVLKHTASNELSKAIREVHKGKNFFSPAVAQLMAQHQLKPGAPERPANPVELTSREAEVLQLIAEGFSNKQIATELNISTKTVEKHRQQVMNKLNLHDTAGLTRYAMSKGIVEPNGLAIR